MRPLRIPESRCGQFVFFFVTECLSYFLVVANTRAFTQANYAWTAATDMLFAASTFLVIKLLADQKEARTVWAGLGYTVGGTCGSLISIWVTVHVYGQ